MNYGIDGTGRPTPKYEEIDGVYYVKKEMDEPLCFCEMVQLLKTAVNADVIPKDPNDDKRILVVMDKMKDGKQVLGSFDLMEMAQKLMVRDNGFVPEGQAVIREAVAEKGYDVTLFNENSFEPSGLMQSENDMDKPDADLEL